MMLISIPLSNRLRQLSSCLNTFTTLQHINYAYPLLDIDVHVSCPSKLPHLTRREREGLGEEETIETSPKKTKSSIINAKSFPFIFSCTWCDT